MSSTQGHLRYGSASKYVKIPLRVCSFLETSDMYILGCKVYCCLYLSGSGMCKMHV